MNEMPPSTAGIPEVPDAADTIKIPDTLKTSDTLKTPPPQEMLGDTQTVIADLEIALRAQGKDMVNLSEFRTVAGLVVEAVKNKPDVTEVEVRALYPANPDLASEIHAALTHTEPTPPAPAAAAMPAPEAYQVTEAVSNENPANDNGASADEEEPPMRIAA